MFKVGEYVVILDDNAETNNWQNYVFKVKKQQKYMYPEIHLTGPNNDSSYASFNHKSKWRYATKEEIEAYDLAGKPIDVTTIISKNNEENTCENHNYLLTLLSKLSIK